MGGTLLGGDIADQGGVTHFFMIQLELSHLNGFLLCEPGNLELYWWDISGGINKFWSQLAPVVVIYK